MRGEAQCGQTWARRHGAASAGSIHCHPHTSHPPPAHSPVTHPPILPRPLLPRLAPRPRNASRQDTLLPRGRCDAADSGSVGSERRTGEGLRPGGDSSSSNDHCYWVQGPHEEGCVMGVGCVTLAGYVREAGCVRGAGGVRGAAEGGCAGPPTKHGGSCAPGPPSPHTRRHTRHTHTPALPAWS